MRNELPIDSTNNNNNNDNSSSSSRLYPYRGRQLTHARPIPARHGESLPPLPSLASSGADVSQSFHSRPCAWLEKSGAHGGGSQALVVAHFDAFQIRAGAASLAAAAWQASAARASLSYWRQRVSGRQIASQPHDTLDSAPDSALACRLTGHLLLPSRFTTTNGAARRSKRRRRARPRSSEARRLLSALMRARPPGSASARPDFFAEPAGWLASWLASKLGRAASSSTGEVNILLPPKARQLPATCERGLSRRTGSR